MLCYKAFFKGLRYVSPTIKHIVVYENLVIPSKLTKRLGSMTYILHMRGRLLVARY
jgi:hypothetical protein